MRQRIIDAAPFVIDLMAKFNGIQALAKNYERSYARETVGIVALASCQPVQGLARDVITAAQLRPGTRLFQLLCRRLKQIHSQTQRAAGLFVWPAAEE